LTDLTPTAEDGPIPAAPLAEPLPWAWLIGLTATALAIRLVYVLWLHRVGDFLYSDMQEFYETAKGLAEPGHVLGAWDVVKPRGLPTVGGWLLATFHEQGRQLWGLTQALLSAAAVPLTFFGARRFLGQRVALVAAGLLTFDFLAVGYAGFVMSETYLTFFLALAFACLDSGRPLRCLLAGLALGLGAQFKSQALPLAVVWMALLLLWTAPRRPQFAGWLFARPRVAAALLAVGVLAVQLPASLALSRILGHPAVLPPYGGQMFYLGHCDVRTLTMDGGPDGTWMTSGNTKASQLNEPWRNQKFNVSVLDWAFFVKRGSRCLKSLPHVLGWTARQLVDVLAGFPGATIDPWPLRMDHPWVTRVFNCTLAYVLFPLALWGLWRRRRELGAWLAIGGPIGAVWGITLLFMGNPRFREPFDLFILSGAAIGLTAIWDRLSRR
jgi:hypothetical protein